MYMHLKVYEMSCNLFNDCAYYLYQMENLFSALFFFYSFLKLCSYKVFVCILFFTLAVMMNIPSLHMMNIIPPAASILSASSASPSLD